jgi:glutaredoxin-related protein
MNKLLILIASVTLLASCSKKKPTVFENDTDSHDWINQKTIKEISGAHSGSSASVIDSVHMFSLGFSKTIEDINSKFKEVEFSYWVFVKSDKAKLSTVFSVDFNGKNVDWTGRKVNIKELNTWIEVRETYKLTPNTKPNNQIGIYALNESKEEILIDDLKLEFK